jgi:hypothetical protein
MQLPNAAGVEAHIHAGDFLGDAELSYRDLTGPAATLLPHMGVRKGEAQIGKRTVIGGRRIEQIGILPVANHVARTGIGAAAGRCGWGIASLVCAAAAPARVRTPPAAVAASMARRVTSSIALAP